MEISTVPVGADEDALKRDLDEYGLTQAKELRKRIDSYIFEKEETMGDFEDELLTREEEEELGEEEDVEEDEDVDEDEETEEDEDVDEDEETEEDEETDDDEARKKEIYGITPRGLEHVADRCVMEGLSVREARTELKKELEKQMKPVGMPDADDEERRREAEKGKNASGRETPEVSERVIEQAVFVTR
jgi:hypothetical protein